MSDVHAYCYSIDSLGTSISNYTKTTTHYGSSTGTLENRDCGSVYKVIVGARVYKTAGGYAAGMQLYCRDMPGVNDSTDALTGTVLGSTGSGGSNYNDLKCPAGEVALGLAVYYGSILDKFGFSCGPITGVTQASITSVTLNLPSKTYPYSQSLSVSSLSGGSGSGGNSVTSVSNGTATGCSLTGSTLSSSTAGTCNVTVTKASDTNYASATTTTTFTFNKATLNVTASSPSVNYGDPIPIITPTYSGFVNSENASSSSFTTGLVAPSCTTSYTSTSPVDTSPATTCSGGSSVGYSFNFISGKVFIISGADKSVSLNGSNQYLSTPDNSNFDITGSITLEAWTYITNTSANSAVICKQAEYLIMSAGGTWKYYLQGSSGWVGVNTGVPTVANEWHHVALTRAASTNSVNFYLDGNLVFTGSADGVGTGLINNTSNDFVIGSHNKDSSYFPGKIDEVRVWNLVRSQSNLKDDMKTWGPQNSSGLVAYYDFNEMVGNTTVNNRSSSTVGQLNLTTTNNPTIETIAVTSTYQAYTVVTFPRTYLVSTGGWKFPDTTTAIQYLIVGGGGGGGGGYNGGGGGAGGFRESTTVVNTSSFISVVVGQGGNGAINIYGPSNGETSTIFGLNATGGGKGATEQQSLGGPNQATNPDGRNSIGGSGGGGTHGSTNATTWGSNISGAPGNAGNYSPSEGNAGGSGASGGDINNLYLAGGGGGGAGGVGGNADQFTGGNPGNGGIGKTSYITGNALNLAGGGAGAGRFRVGSINDNLKHGTSSSGGGNGTCITTCTVDTGTAGSPNTGGGGGGGAAAFGVALGGNGGSGFIAVRYITNKPTIFTQPTNDTSTVGAVDTFTISTSVAPAPLTKSVQWQYTADTTTAVIANITGWTNVSTGTGFTTDTFTTAALTKSMNKYRYRAIVTFSDTATITSVETSTIATLTINDAITWSVDSSTITRKYGDSQTVRPINYSGGTTSTGSVGTSTSHTVATPYGPLANGKIYVDTTTSSAYFKVDTGTVVGTYYETVTVTDYLGASASYVQKVIVSPADTLTVQADTLTAITFGGTVTPSATVITGLKNGDTVATTNFGFVSCANGGLCEIGDIGPGGGVVFYKSLSTTDSQTAITGYTSGGIYLEAAPVGWGNGISVAAGETTGTSYLDPVVNWCNTAFDFNSKGTGIGLGGDNSKKMDTNCSSGAGQIAVDLVLNGKNDWYLPSQDELTQMGIQKNLIGLLYGVNNCYESTCYWSSTQNGGGSSVRGLQVAAGSETMGNNDTLLTASNKVMMRPIRAFSPIVNGTETVTAGAPTAAGTYKIVPTAITLANDVSTNNYVAVVYNSSKLTINRATQTPKISMQPAKAIYDTGTATQAVTATSGLGSGNIFYILGAGSAASCTISGSSVLISAEGVCNVIAYKQASANYLYDSATAVAITFTRFVSNQQVQVQLYPTMIPLNGKNSLETATLTIPVISSVTFTDTQRILVNGSFQIIPAFYEINGSGFTGATRVLLNFSDITPFTFNSDIKITFEASAAAGGGIMFIETSDGRIGPTPFYNFTP